MLLRFCLENRLPDLRFFFTMRTQEEGRHAEASWLMAERLGGYFPQPQNPPTVSAVGTHGVRRMAFDPETSLEGIFASLVCAAEEILIDAFKATVHKATNPAVRRLMELILRDEVRHIAFGWQCLDAWAPTFTPETVKNIERAVTQMIQNVEFNGYRNLWLAVEGGSATPLEIDADRVACEAGLGGTTPEDEMRVVPPVHREDPGAHGAVGRGAADVRPSQAGARLGVAISSRRVPAKRREGAGGLPAGHAESQPFHHSHGATRSELAPSAARRRYGPAGRPPAPSRRRVVNRFQDLGQARRDPREFAALVWSSRSAVRRPSSCPWHFGRALCGAATRWGLACGRLRLSTLRRGLWRRCSSSWRDMGGTPRCSLVGRAWCR